MFFFYCHFILDFLLNVTLYLHLYYHIDPSLHFFRLSLLLCLHFHLDFQNAFDLDLDL